MILVNVLTKTIFDKTLANHRIQGFYQNANNFSAGINTRWTESRRPCARRTWLGAAPLPPSQSPFARVSSILRCRGPSPKSRSASPSSREGATEVSAMLPCVRDVARNRIVCFRWELSCINSTQPVLQFPTNQDVIIYTKNIVGYIYYESTGLRCKVTPKGVALLPDLAYMCLLA